MSNTTPSKRSHWGKGIAAVYILFVLGILSFVGFALTQSVDLVRSDYYEASLSYSKSAEARQRATALKMDDSVRVGNDGGLVVAMPQAAYTDATIFCYRADSPSMDVHKQLSADSWLHEFPPSMLAAGKWRVVLQWKHDGTPYEFEKVIMIWNTSQG
ncbi:MAG: FixH family protein [Bradyrhizobiaceae bacterium]|nr:FixH family protein [Bradyrhizobiaceae bacterium]